MALVPARKEHGAENQNGEERGCDGNGMADAVGFKQRFAIDSIRAIFAITEDTFIVYAGERSGGFVQTLPPP